MIFPGKISINDVIVPPDEIGEVERYLPPLDDFNTHEGWLWHGVKEGIYQTAEICQDNEKIALLFFSIGPSLDRVLVVTAVKSVVSRDVSLAIHLATEELARRNQCTAIEFTTRRMSMAAKSARLGYEAIGVVMRKKIQ